MRWSLTATAQMRGHIRPLLISGRRNIRLAIIVPLRAGLDQRIFQVSENGCRYGFLDLNQLALVVGQLEDTSEYQKYKYLISELKKVEDLKYLKRSQQLSAITGEFRSSFDVCGDHVVGLPTTLRDWEQEEGSDDETWHNEVDELGGGK